MTELKDLLNKRKIIKRKKPDFIMQDAHKKGRLEKKWKRPRGIDSKMRLNLKGYSKCVEGGYGSPKEVRGLDKSGLEPVLVSTIKELERITKEKQGIIISSSVGMKKRAGIITKARESNIKILNIKDAQKYLDKITEDMKKRKEQKKEKKAKAEKKAKEQKKEKKDDKLADKVMSEEEKAKAVKEEKDKLLTKKDIQ